MTDPHTPSNTTPLHILVDIGHPGDVHVFYQPILKWQARGHHITVTTTDKDVSLQLLDFYGLDYHVIGVRKPGLMNLAWLLVARTLRIIWLSRRGRPDILVSISSATAALASQLMNRPHIAFDDSEFGTQQRAVYKPFTEAICTPRQFEVDFGKKHVRYDGFKELAYLHPNYFTPNPDVLRGLGIDPNEQFFVLRLVSWDAAHDYGEHGFTPHGREQLIKRLQKVGRVIVSYEGQVPKDLSTGQNLPVDAMLHLLAYAHFFISEGLTMVTESALLGTPAILVNTLKAGNMHLLQDRYHLAEIHPNDGDVLAAVERWLADPELKTKAAVNRQRLLDESVDVSQFITDFTEEFVHKSS